MNWNTRPAVRLTVLVDDTDTWHHRNLAGEIVRRARAAGLRGASLFHGVEGFGARQIVHTTRLLSLADELPVAVVIVDDEEAVSSFLPHLRELGVQGLITLEAVRTVHFTDAEDEAS